MSLISHYEEHTQREQSTSADVEQERGEDRNNLEAIGDGSGASGINENQTKKFINLQDGVNPTTAGKEVATDKDQHVVKESVDNVVVEHNEKQVIESEDGAVPSDAPDPVRFVNMKALLRKQQPSAVIVGAGTAGGRGLEEEDTHEREKRLHFQRLGSAAFVSAHVPLSMATSTMTSSSSSSSSSSPPSPSTRCSWIMRLMVAM
mmetsp:Transcript_9591/g.15961  ORF Transcript_9591/g.15961 Transcript_9591/m.15961 type:complete len:204 (-) Transcript_9591:518-1129(-)